MPLTTNADKQNDKPQQASESDEELIDFKKFYLYFGIGVLFVSVMLSVTNYFFFEKEKICLWGVTFFLVVSADILILLPAIITKETNWLALLGSTILCIVFLCLSVFYPFQDFQYRLKVISVVAIVATLLFVLLNSWINAAFFPSKNANIRQSVDFASNRFAVDVLNVTLILGTLFGTIAFLYFNPDKDNSTFFGGIDIKNVALATAGLVTFFWAAKATKNKSIELEEKKQDGKRHDNEIAMAKQRDTAQLIAEASKLLCSENDTQKYAGLSFLNKIASDSEGTFRKEAFDLIADFILTASDITTANKVRMRAIHYADDLVGNDSLHFEIEKIIPISSTDSSGSDKTVNDLDNFKITNLYVSYIELSLGYEFIQRVVKSKLPLQFAFLRCTFYGKNFEDGTMEIIKNIKAKECEFKYCRIKKLNTYTNFFDKIKTENLTEYKKYFEKNVLQRIYLKNKFDKCDFSNCINWVDYRDSVIKGKDALNMCFYYSGHAPKGFDKTEESNLLVEITSKEQFDELFGSSILMTYSPPDDKK